MKKVYFKPEKGDFVLVRDELLFTWLVREFHSVREGLASNDEGNFVVLSPRLKELTSYQYMIPLCSDTVRYCNSVSGPDGIKYIYGEEPKPGHQFKPFDRVLVRGCGSDIWKVDLFDSYNDRLEKAYLCVGYAWPVCIPYEGNEHLHCTTDSPEEDDGE